MEEWLNQQGLGSYAKAFIDNGYDDVEDLVEYQDAQLEELKGLVGLKPGHFNRFKGAIEKLKNDKKVRDYLFLLIYLFFLGRFHFRNQERGQTCSCQENL